MPADLAFCPSVFQLKTYSTQFASAGFAGLRSSPPQNHGHLYERFSVAEMREMAEEGQV